MEIIYHSKLVPEFLLSPDKKPRWKLDEPFDFSVDGRRFTAPKGFYTDFASVPRIIWPVISPYDLGVGPIPHDLGYFTGYANKEYWDIVFLACMEKDGIANWKRQAAYRAVDWFGGFVWDKYRRENSAHLFTGTTHLEVSHWGLRGVDPKRTREREGSRGKTPEAGVAWQIFVQHLTATLR